MRHQAAIFGESGNRYEAPENRMFVKANYRRLKPRACAGRTNDYDIQW
jgi:hypothetical protein